VKFLHDGGIKMNKLSILVVAMFVIMIANVMAVPVEKFCQETNGATIWTGGLTTDEKGVNAFDCDGASENLKVFTCDGDKVKVDNVKCSDYDAVCVIVGDKTVSDYCGCDTGSGYVFSESQQKCVYVGTNDGGDDGGPNGVPEFSPLTLGIATIVGAIGLLFLRKN
jgi:hypothetical protein